MSARNITLLPVRWTALCVTFLLGCRLGRPPATRTFVPGSVRTTSPQPELAESLRAAFAAALVQRGALDAGAGTAVQLTVLSEESGVVATNNGSQLHVARLVVEVQTTGARPRSVIVRGARSYPVDPGAPLAAAAARAAAIEALAAELMEDAVEWLLYQEVR